MRSCMSRTWSCSMSAPAATWFWPALRDTVDLRQRGRQARIERGPSDQLLRGATGFGQRRAGCSTSTSVRRRARCRPGVDRAGVGGEALSLHCLGAFHALALQVAAVGTAGRRKRGPGYRIGGKRSVGWCAALVFRRLLPGFHSGGSVSTARPCCANIWGRDRGLATSGVRGHDLAFAAHCWLQIDDLVLNDRLDQVQRYTPILAV